MQVSHSLPPTSQSPPPAGAMQVSHSPPPTSQSPLPADQEAKLYLTLNELCNAKSDLERRLVEKEALILELERKLAEASGSLMGQKVKQLQSEMAEAKARHVTEANKLHDELDELKAIVQNQQVVQEGLEAELNAYRDPNRQVPNRVVCGPPSGIGVRANWRQV